MYKNILVPSDGSKLSAKAVKQAIKLAKAISAKITAVYVMPPVSDVPLSRISRAYDVSVNEGYILPASLNKKIQEDIGVRSKQMLARVCAEAATAGVECESVLAASGAPYERIIEHAAKSKCDLIMMASHGRRGVSGLLLGSETTKVLVHSRIPVLVVR